MRINAWITPENRQRLSTMITEVNWKRLEAGLDPLSQAHVINDIIERAWERDVIQIGGFYIINRREPAKEPDHE